MEFTFTLSFHTPLLSGGAKNELEPLGLTVKSLRYAWRFWFRALYGGCGANLQDCHEKEAEIFGSTKRSCLRIRVKRPKNIPSSEYARCPHKWGGARAVREGCNMGAQFEVKISTKPGFYRAENPADNEIILRAAIALWGCLGALGCRSRRGFGSPGIKKIKMLRDAEYTSISENYFDFGPLNTDNYQDFSASLTDVLNSILAEVCALIGTNLPRPYSGTQLVPVDFFQFMSLDQVFITELGNVLFSNTCSHGERWIGCKNRQRYTCSFTGEDCQPDTSGIIHNIHGGQTDDLGYADNRGKMPSPYYVRLLKLSNNNYVAICTFSPVRDPDRRFSWVRGAQRRANPYSTIFTNSLTGNTPFI